MRTKTTERWIRSDPLRARYWDAGCPSGPHGDDALLGFTLTGVNGPVRRVFCYECGWSSDGN